MRASDIAALLESFCSVTGHHLSADLVELPLKEMESPLLLDALLYCSRRLTGRVGHEFTKDHHLIPPGYLMLRHGASSLAVLQLSAPLDFQKQSSIVSISLDLHKDFLSGRAVPPR